MFNHPRVLPILLLAVFGNPALAEPLSDEDELAQAYGDTSFVSIATGTRQQIRKAPAAATVITADQIASMGARNLSEALVAVPGMHISRNRLQHIYTPTYGVRGILGDTSPHVLMLVNGIPRTSAYLGNPDEEMVELPVDNIARIEVIRGPGSAVYGADAFAGTINIVTKTAGDINGTQFGLNAGSFNSRHLWLQHGRRHESWEVAGYLRFGSTDGSRKRIESDAIGQSGPLNLQHEDIDAQLDLGIDQFRWRAAYTLRDKLGTGLGIAGVLDPGGRIRSERISSDLSWSSQNLVPDLDLNLQAAFMQLANTIPAALTIYPGGVIPGFPDGMQGVPDKWERQARFSATAVHTGFNDHRIRFGLGHDYLEIHRTRESKNFTFFPFLAPRPMYEASGADLFLSPHSRKLDYFYLQDEWSFARSWTLTGGLRRDYYSDFGGTTNPRLALVWEAAHDLTTKIMYGTAFRAPSFIEQYASGNPVALGNPALKPEKIATLEAGATWRPTPALQTSLNLFRHEISDLIGQSGNTYLNGGKQNGKGGEFELIWDLGYRLRLTGNYAYQKNIDVSTGRDAGYAPHHRFYLRADWRGLPGWQFSSQINRVADRHRAAGDPRPEIPDYTSVDLTLRSDRPKQGWDVSLSIYNLFDTDIREPSKTAAGIPFDYRMPGRTLWLQGRYSL